jgi:HemY protein
MKWLISLVLIVALAVAAATAARMNAGYLLFVYPPYRVEMSLPFAVAALVLGFFAAYALLRLAVSTLGLPEKVRVYRTRRSRNRARNAMEQAITAYFEGHYRRAERLAGVALKLRESPTVSGILAARAAHEQRNYEARDNYLKTVDAVAPEDSLLKLITEAEFLLEERRASEALEVLNRARVRSPKNPAIPRLEMRAHTLAKNWEQVLESANRLGKQKEMDSTQLEPVRLLALKENLKLKGHDAQTLKEQWKRIAAADRTDPEIAAAAARAFADSEMGEEARQIVERALDKQWNAELVTLYGEISAEDPLKQIERAEAWLHERPGDANLLMTLGKLCTRERLWGKAQSYLEASISVEPSRAAHAAYAKLMERMGKPELALTYNRRRTG